MLDVHFKLNPGFPSKKQYSTWRILFYKQIGQKYEEETSKELKRDRALYGTENWTLWKLDQKYMKRFERGVREGWRRSFGPIVWDKRHYAESKKREASCVL
jgi:hypothetical protein